MLARRGLLILAATGLAFLFWLSASSRFTTGWSGLDTPYRYGPQNNGTTPDDNVTRPSESHNGSPSDSGAGQGVLSACADFPDMSKIMVVMKTGASESFAKVPTQLMTMLRCLPDTLIFSDMDQNIAGYQLLDSLDEVPRDITEKNPDFDLYRRQKTCLIDVETCNKLGNPASEGWKLDKYKNVHIAEKAYSMRPGYDWYLFIDADTYVLFHNLARWLSMMDPNKKHYLGSVTLINDFGFAHGGSGYVVSRAAMEAMVGQNPGIGSEYDYRAAEECCGDYVFGMAMKEKAGIEVEQMWPTINGEKPTRIPFGPSHWCQPIATMHHLNSEELENFWKFENDWLQKQKLDKSTRPLLMKDIYHHYLEPRIVAKRVDWDNISDDRFYFDPGSGQQHDDADHMMSRMKNLAEYNVFEKKAHLSFEHCEAACQSLPSDECFQFKYRDGVCSFSRSIRLGKPVKRGDDGKHTVSGWDVAKIAAWVATRESCSRVEWPGQ
ncbi:glycosyltransferase [Echria macrotheca]|uniref:N-acetylgalactosaminide beta-1,3-galactosyltransferase n=1 Tax=Echria macrotheca TaxID=438768 RepID=A0AAJ0BNV2_9PEZI|nr:glycosyltransferase [Echria macrotheca]